MAEETTECLKILVYGDDTTRTCEAIRNLSNGTNGTVTNVEETFDKGQLKSYHSILITINIQNIAKWKHVGGVKEIVERFGENIYRHMIVVFTSIDTVDEASKNDNLYVTRHASKGLQQLLQKCNLRYVSLNNTAEQDQIKSLLEEVKTLAYANGGIYKHRYIILGSKKSGKSTLANFIIDRKIFKTGTSTDKCRCVEGHLDGLEMMVIDTPAVPDGHDENRVPIEQEISQNIVMTAPGPRNVILAVRQDQPTEELHQCMNYIRKYFGEDALSDILLTITHTDKLSDREFKMFAARHTKHVQKVLNNLKRIGRVFYYNEIVSPASRKKDIIRKAASSGKLEHSLLNYVLIGPSGVGKSYAGNNILGEEVFETRHRTQRVTAATRYIDDRRVTVVDTPGLVDDDGLNQESLREIKHHVTKLSKMPILIVHVMRYFKPEEGLPEKEKRSLDVVGREFKESIPNKLVILFTYIDQIENFEPAKYENFLRSLPDDLKELALSCHYRCIAFDNVTQNKTVIAEQRDHLLLVSDNLLQGNNGLRLVLLGITGDGKSSTGNTLCQEEEDVFAKSISQISETEKCQMHVIDDKDIGLRITVVDTPGLFDNRPKFTQYKSMAEISRCLFMTLPGPHAFLVVSSIGSKFTAAPRETLQLLEKMFGIDIWRHAVFILSKKDQLKVHKMELESYLEEKTGPVFAAYLQSCNDRILAVSNAEPTGQERKELMYLVGPMIASQRGRHFTNKTYEEISRRLWLFGTGKGLSARHFVERNDLVCTAIYTIGSILIGAGVFATGLLSGPVALAALVFHLGVSWWVKPYT